MNNEIIDMPKFTTEDVIVCNQKLLDAIAACDYDVYKELCAEDLTAFEPESHGMLVQGLNFHKYYFDLFRHPSVAKKTEQMPIICNAITMSNPHVRWIGGGEAAAAVISYVRLDQSMTAEVAGQ